MYGTVATSIKFYPKLKIYKNSTGNVTFDPATITADSYNWWTFVKVIKGKVVFNNYYYSSSTSAHQSLVKDVMKELGIKVDVYVNQSGSLGHAPEVKFLYERLFKGQIHNANPKTRNKYSKQDFDEIKAQIKKVKALGATFSKNEQKAFKFELEQSEVRRLERLKVEREENKVKREESKKAIKDAIQSGEVFSL